MLLTANQTQQMKTAVTAIVMLAIATSLAGFADAQQRGRLPGDVELEKGPLAADDFEKNALAVLASIMENQRYRNVPQHDGRLLRILAETTGAKNVVELGTSTGYSGIWFGLALKKTNGKLTTYEIDAERAATARENFKKAGMEELITIVEGDAHKEVAKLTGPIDIVFLDADKEGYIDYLTKLLPHIRTGGLVMAHNINPRMADPAYMEAITTNPKLETVVRGGMSITMKK